MLTTSKLALVAFAMALVPLAGCGGGNEESGTANSGTALADKDCSPPVGWNEIDKLPDLYMDRGPELSADETAYDTGWGYVVVSDLLKPCTVWEVHVASCLVWGGEIPENFQTGPNDLWACVQPIE